MIPVKICGITNLADAQLAVKGGASAIGFIFYGESQRYISPGKVEEWLNVIPSSVKNVGVFVNEQIENVHCIAQKLSLDFIQLHGDESPDYCNKMTRPVIKAFRVGDDFDFSILSKYQVHAFLFDTYQKGTPGGTGNVFNWELISNLNIDSPIILSGGLNTDNIKKGIETVNPSAVDVNSGVESKPGVKDNVKMMELFGSLERVKTNIKLTCF